VNRIVKMLGFENLAGSFIGRIIDQHGAEQRLLDLGVARRHAGGGDRIVRDDAKSRNV
jgi:hypothetical protein